MNKNDECARIIAHFEKAIANGELKNWRDCFYTAYGWLEAAGFDAVPFEIIRWLDTAAAEGKIDHTEY